MYLRRWNMALEDKWDKDVKPLLPIKNENLVCNTCANKTQSTTQCVEYYRKPLTVLKGGVCYGYKKK